MSNLCLTSSSFVTSFPPLTTTKPFNSLVRLQQKTTRLPVLRCSVSLDSGNGSGSAQKTKLPSSLGSGGGGSAPTEAAAKIESPALSDSEDVINPTNNTNVVVEHIVLFKMKESGFMKYDEEIMIDAFRSLKCLDGAADRKYLKAGLIPENGQSGDYKFTIFLHSRHSSEEAVNQYMGHRLKAAFSALYTEPYYEDYIIIDYLHDNGVAELTDPAPGQKLRAVFFRLKTSWEGCNQHKLNATVDEHLSATRTSGKTFVGKTYREARKGYGYATLAIVAKEDTLPTAKQLAETLNRELEHIVEEDGVFVVDYEVEE